MTLTFSVLIFMSFYCIVSSKINSKIKGILTPKLFLECSLAFSNTFHFKGIIMQTYHAYNHMKLKRLIPYLTVTTSYVVMTLRVYLGASIISEFKRKCL